MSASITFISAGAGSGKTYRLTDILYTKLSSAEVRPSGVIATTFTKKAAAELRERARSHLMEKGAFALAAALDYARIGTVNSVCGDLLVRFAFEAGLPTEQQVLPEAQAKMLVDQGLGSVTQGPKLAALIAVADRLGIETWRADLKLLVDHARTNQVDLSNPPGLEREVGGHDSAQRVTPQASRCGGIRRRASRPEARGAVSDLSINTGPDSIVTYQPSRSER